MGINKDRPTIGFFAPFASGYYLSTLCTELRKQCALRRMDLVVILTNETTEFDMPLALNYIDAAFIAVDVLSPAFAAQMLARNIPLVSSSEEYFPLEVESVVSDQNRAVELAFDHLYALGHRSIGFVGSLFITDFRLRYKELLNCYREKGMVFNDNWLMDVSDAGIAGGAEGSELFLERNCDCSAVICGSDMMALGMVNALAKKGILIPQQLALVSIDNNPLGQSCSPPLTSIDQKLPLMVTQVLDRLQARLMGQPFTNGRQLIAPRLVIRESCGGSEKLGDRQLKKSDYSNPASYMQDSGELGLAIGGRDYRWMVELSKLWGPFLKWVCLAQWQQSSDIPGDQDYLTVVDVIDDDCDSHLFDSCLNTKIPAEQFPPIPAVADDPAELVYITLIPISPEGLKWGVLTLVDKLDVNMDQAAYNMFFYYVALTSVFMQREALTECIRARERNALNLAERLEVVANASNDGIWTWNLDHNVIEWNNRLLEMLGFITEEDKLHYRHMLFLERIHPQDQDYIRSAIKSHLEDHAPFKLKFRIQDKQGDYLWVAASGEAIREPDGHIGRFVGALTDITDQYKSKQRIKFMAYHDSLTKLPNRIALTERVANQMQLQTEGFAIMLMDLNRFKQVNDRFGHHAGDTVLIHVAEKLTEVLRKHDHVSRFGGDEFVFQIAAESDIEALAIAQRILAAVDSVCVYDGDEITVTGSLGISLYPHHGDCVEELIRKADIAMYHAKSQHDKAQLYREKLEQKSRCSPILPTPALTQ
ncbi:MAG: diguanylate cyclase (GGDEF)-like protein/PAS domain S-box-containing protein [Psychromonas sp.]|jgi:diguanylate cyclase (GGDEF)-like protein/PAS domain S-box-containing protein|uniref:diguanylate cyclase domain-containing protein n=1 Tax=Psychromonas sp. TaxID=1884585 RepID=UPI0039E699E7